MKRLVMAATLLSALLFGLVLSGVHGVAAQDDPDPGIDPSFIGAFGADTDDSGIDPSFIGSAADYGPTAVGEEPAADTAAGGETVVSMPNTGSGPSSASSLAGVATLGWLAVAAALLGAVSLALRRPALGLSRR